MDVGRAVVPHALEVEALQQVEHLQDVDAAGGGGRGGYHLETLETAAHRFSLQRAVVGQVLLADQAAAALHLGDDALGNRPLIKALVAALGDLAQGPGQFRLAPVVTHPVGAAVGLEEQAGGLAVLAQLFCPGGDLELQRPGHFQALFRQRNRGGEHARQGQCAVAFLGQDQAGNGPRDTGGEVAEVAALAVDLALLIQEQVAGGGSGRGFPVVDKGLAVFLVEVDQHETAAAEVARPGIAYGEGEPGGDRSIDGVTTFAQDIEPDFRGQALRPDHHGLARHLRQETAAVVDDGGLLRRFPRQCGGAQCDQQGTATGEQAVAHGGLSP